MTVIGLGNVLVVLSLGGLLLVALESLGVSLSGATGSASSVSAGESATAPSWGGAAAVGSAEAAVAGSGGSVPPSSISRVAATAISLEADVVTAALIEREGGTT